MSIVEIVSQRVQQAFPDENKRTLKAATVIVNVGRLIPPSYVYPLPPLCTNEVLVAHNVLMGSENVQQQLNFDFNIGTIQ
ncbi:unnamed protein product, partial [Adineta ricciae]